MNTRESAIVIFLAITVGTLDCSSADRIAPAPTPLPLDETKAVGLSTDIRLVDVFGDVAVDIADGDLWLVNVRIGDPRQLTDDGHPKHDVALSGDYVAWIDQRSMIPLPGYSVPVLSSDVFVRNRHTGEERRITDTPASRHGLRNGLLADRRRDYDIYAYDLERDLEIPVALAPGRQLMPVIHGDMVVWSDNRNSRLGERPRPAAPIVPTIVSTSTRTTWPPQRKSRWWNPVVITVDPPFTASW